MKARVLVLVLMAAYGLVSGTTAFAEEDVKVKLSTGFDFSTGDYGNAQDTEIWYWPIAAKATFGNWAAKLTVPYLRIKGPGAVVGGGGAGITQGGGGNITTESGLGDILAGLTYTIDVEKYDAFVDLTGKVKIPTADEDKGLGTGEADYTIQGDITKMFGSAYIFGGGGRKFVGESAQFQLDDIWLFNIGAGYQINKKFGIGAAYDFRESASSSQNPSEVSGYLTYKVTDAVSTLLYGVTGFTDGSPDASVGLQVSYGFEPFKTR